MSIADILLGLFEDKDSFQMSLCLDERNGLYYSSSKTFCLSSDGTLMICPNNVVNEMALQLSANPNYA